MKIPSGVLQWFNQLPMWGKSAIRSGIISTLVIAVFQIGNSARKDYIILAKEEVITQNRKQIQQLEIVNKNKDIELERLRKENLELKIDYVKLQTAFNNVRANTDNMPLVYWERETGTELFTYVNPAFERQVLEPLGYDRHDILYTNGAQIFGKKYASQYLKSFRWVVKTGKIYAGVEPSKDVTGKIVSWKSTKFPIYESGELSRVGGISYKVEHK
ncbi:hypothetical protein [Croceivirga sp. JEA036]|uniref:hypothetical protein n=1 Tax=Croceivirga sp. JEA036 TaxID=2721162 RepID=UPI00143ADF10|nr:hypothetical protein [Croceivirga sp. JEA036]NJB36398.1 hypothetical protein [Croceivirga sp. JEA036]